MPTERPPLVAVTATTNVIDGLRRVRLNEAYVRALAGAGAVPVVVPPLAPTLAGALLGRVDGLVLSGGEDLDPARYGAAPHPRLGPVHAERDAIELALVSEARRRRMPLLAICRGIQTLGVALGGTLVQDIPSERAAALGHDRAPDRALRVHDVDVAADSRLAAALGASGTVRVNSSHHQSIDRSPDALRVVARSPDGIIEAVETTDDDWWVLGVQWHPEELVATDEPWDRALFAAFVEECRRSRSKSRRVRRDA